MHLLDAWIDNSFFSFSGSISIKFDVEEDNIVLPSLSVFAMCVWLCSYFEFFDQKVNYYDYVYIDVIFMYRLLQTKLLKQLEN